MRRKLPSAILGALGIVIALSATPAVAVTVDSVFPSSGPESGGTLVIVTGTGFEPGAIVSFGGAPVATTFFDSTQLRCTTPPGTGTVDVAATNPDTQSGTLLNGFTYNPVPTVSNVTPGNGPETGATSVTITGTGFLSGPFVFFGLLGVADNVVVVDSTAITCSTPPGTGTVNIEVLNQDGQSGLLSAAFTYDVVPPPTVTDVSPGNGPESGGTSVTVTGTNFMNGASVKFGGGFASAVVVVSTTEITCNTPSGSGTVDVVVRNADGDSDTLSSAFSYDPPPSITSVSRDHGPESGGTNVTITGTNFDVSASVTVGGVSALNVSVVSPASISCTTPGGIGVVDIVVTNPDAQSDTLAAGFVYVPPEGDDGGCSPGRGGCPGWSLALLVLTPMLLRKRCSGGFRGDNTQLPEGIAIDSGE